MRSPGHHDVESGKIEAATATGDCPGLKLGRRMNMGGNVRVNPLGVGILVFFCIVLIYFNLGGGGSSSEAGSGPTVKNGGKVSMKQLLAVSIQMAKRGGDEVKRIREQAEIGEKSKGKTREGANNPVTDGDMLSHRAMYYGMLKAFPGLSVISEEHDPQPIDMTTIALPAFTDSEVNAVISDDKDVMMSIEEVDVWIDPLDATQEYTENLLEFVTTMVCVAVRGKPVLGVIYKPFENLTAWGWVGPNFVSRIVEKDVRNNHAKEHHDVALSRLIVSRSHAGSVHDVAEAAFGSKATVTPAGGAGFKSWEVMKGVQDAYVHVTLIKKWDLCAGDAILRALGGQLTTLKGAPIDYSGRPAEERNEGGVIATMHDHDAYVEALKHVPVETKRKEP